MTLLPIEKLIVYVPDYRTKEQFEVFLLRVNKQIEYLKWIKKETKRKKKALKKKI